MSMGPEKKDEVIPEKTIQTLRISAKKSLKAYSENPLHYLFYFALTAIVIGLIFNVSFSWKLYLITFTIGIVNFFQNIYDSDENRKLQDAIDKDKKNAEINKK